MQISLYKFSKKINSTARPSGAGTVVEVSIKQNVPVANSFDQSADTYLTMPVFFLSTLDGTVNFGVDSYNYVKAWDKYYWINNIEIGLNQTLVLYCQIDVLATHRNDIIGSTQYISYSSSGYNENIDDTRLTVTNDTEFRQIGTAGLLPGLTSTTDFAYYHMMITTNDGTYPCYLSPTLFEKFWTDFISRGEDSDTELSNIFGAPINVIGSMHAMYYKPQDEMKDLPLNIGQHWYGMGGRTPVHNSYRTEYRVTIENTVPTNKRGERLTDYMLSLPMVGWVKCENGIINTANYLRVTFILDHLSLDVGYYVIDDKGRFVAEGYGNAGQDIMYGQIINPNDASGVYYHYTMEQAKINAQARFGNDVALAGLSATVGSGKSIAPAVKDSLSLGFDYWAQSKTAKLTSDMAGYQATVSRSSTLGGANSGSLIPASNHTITLVAFSGVYTAEPSSIAYYFGRPVCAVQSLVGDGRLVICPDPVITLDTVSAIIQQIVTLMRGGIYLD